MNKELEAGLLKEMGYTAPRVNFCKDCKFYHLKDGFIDRTWDSYCNFYNSNGQTFGLIKIDDSGNGCCDKFERKVK